MKSERKGPASPGTKAMAGCPLALKDYRPRSMLRVPEHRLLYPSFPVIDVHSHLSRSRGLQGTDCVGFLASPEELLPVMDRKHVRTMCNLTGGTGAGLERAIGHFDLAAPGRFVTFTEPSWTHIREPGYPEAQAWAIEGAVQAGARGLKVLKTLGLFLREDITAGPLVAVDDPRFDPMWEACAGLDIPVSIHVADPAAFFLPVNRFNERYEELSNHPDWSFHGRDFPSMEELLAARDRVLSRHPCTRFILNHVGHFAEDLAFVSETLDRFPNTTVEMGARISELGRQPRTARKFFEAYQDRILFGTDAVPHGHETPQQVFCDELYEIYYRFLETEDEYFEYAPASVPPQGRWQIYGLGLPASILKKVYHDNSARELGLPPL
jgi:predicted TIM-barrel fold metal-dependent hydrolase